MPSYDGATFGERGRQSGTFSPQYGRQTQATPRMTTYGTTKEATTPGITPTVLTVPAKMTVAELAALRDKAGYQLATLIYAGGTVSNVGLMEIDGLVLVKDSKDTIFGDLHFIFHHSASAGGANITEEVGKTFHYVNTTVTVGGVEVDPLEITVSHAIDQDAGHCTMVFPSAVSGGTIRGAVAVELGFHNNGQAVFSGTVTGRTWDHFPTGYAVDVRDRMDYLTYPYGGTERTYISATDGTIIQNLVEAMGVNSANTSIQDFGWTIGITEPLIVRKGDRMLPLIRQIDQLAGYATFTKGVDSAIYRQPATMGTASVWTYTEGVNVVSARRTQQIDGLYNQVTVDGLTYEGASVSVTVGTASAYVRSPPGTIGYAVQSNLVESSARGTIVANTLLTYGVIPPETYQLVVPGNPIIEPGDTITVTHSDLALSSTFVWVTKVEHRVTDASFLTTIDAKKVP